MDPMIIGTTVPFMDGAAVTLLSPWMPRQGNTVRFTVELIDAVEIKLIIQTKNVEDIDSAATDVANSQSDTNPVTVRGTGQLDGRVHIRLPWMQDELQRMLEGVS